MPANRLFFFFLFCLILKGIGNKTEISVRGQDRLIISSPSQRNEKSTQNVSSPETTSGSAGGYDREVPKQLSLLKVNYDGRKQFIMAYMHKYFIVRIITLYANSVTPVPEDLTPSPGLHRHLVHTWCTHRHTCRLITHPHKIKFKDFDCKNKYFG